MISKCNIIQPSEGDVDFFFSGLGFLSVLP
jgi:hypothetical protein